MVSLFCHPAYSGTGDTYYMDDIIVTSNVQTITISVPDKWQSYYYSHNGFDGFTWSVLSNNGAVYFVSSTSGTSCTITVKANLLNGNDKLYCHFGYWLGGVTPYFTELIWKIKKGTIPIPVEDIKLDNSSVSLLVGEEKQLTATVLPSNATNKSVTWSSDKTSVATISSSGLITAVGTGSAKILCKANDNSGVKAECYVDVAPSEFTSTTVEGVEVLFHILDRSEMTCAVGGYDSYGSSKNAIDKNTEGTVTIPEKVNGYRVVEILGSAFSNCESVNTINLPSSVTAIGNYAFYYCQSLTTITGTENLEYIGYRSFYDTPWLKSFDDGPVYIGKVLYTYNGNISEDITLDVKEGTTCISGGGLYMNHIVGINIPKSVKYVGSSKDDTYFSPFYYSGLVSKEGLSSITVASGNEVYDSRGGCNAVIEKNTNKLVAGCRASIIPNDVITIGERSFDGIPVESIVIPDNVKTIENGAFDRFYGRDIVIGAGVESIHPHAFLNTSEKLRYIKVSSGNTHYDSRNNCNAIIETATNKLILGGPSTVIPSTVKTIGESAFSYCASALVIPDGVETLERNNFNNLKTLTIGKGLKDILPYVIHNNRISIIHASSPTPNTSYENAFGYCYDNTTLVVPVGSKSKYQSAKGWDKFKNIIESNGHVDGDAFIAETIEGYPLEYRVISESAKTCELVKPLYKDDIIGTITIPATAEGYQVISIGSQAFQSCKSLETIAGGKNVEAVGIDAFGGTTWYNNLPEGATYLGKVLMKYVDTPSSGILNIKDGTTCIYYVCYGHVNKLKFVRIPESVKLINDYALQYCSNLVGIISMIKEPFEINAKVFNNSHFTNATLYVPSGTKARYQATEGWNKFQNIVEGEPVFVTAITLNKTSISLITEQEEVLSATVKPDDATDKTVVWSSSNTKVATVNREGKVTAIAAGTAIITCSANDGSGVKATCEVTVTSVVKSIELPATMTVAAGQTVTLTPTITPAGAETTLTWSSDDETIAMVNSEGVVTGVKKGQTFINVETDNGKTAYCKLTVVPGEPVSITLPKSTTLHVGETVTLTPTITPEDAETTLTWKSDDETILRVSADGVLTGVAEGLAIVTVTTSNGITSNACKVKVEPDPSGISDVQTADKAASVYSLSGQRLAAPKKGINIVGGHKVIVK